MRRDLRREHPGIAQRAAIGRRSSSSSSGMLDHRKYDSRDASSWGPIGTAASGRPRGCASVLDAEQEVGRDQDRLHRQREPLLERAAVLATGAKSAVSRSISRGATGRRYARCASRVRILRSQPCACRPSRGRTRRSCEALGGAPAATANGPEYLHQRRPDVRWRASAPSGRASKFLRISSSFSGGSVLGRLELARRRRRACGRVRTVVVGRQAFVEPLDRRRDSQCSPAGTRVLKIAHHAGEVVAVAPRTTPSCPGPAPAPRRAGRRATARR